MLETHALQGHLVSVLLRLATGPSPTLAAVDEMERACKQLFLSSYTSCYCTPFPAVLDVLLVLYKQNPNFAKELLSCVVLLCLCSIEAWYHAAESTLFDIFPQSAPLLAKVAIGRNPSWSHWLPEEQEMCSTACMELSDLDKYIEAGYVPRATPISVSVRGFETSTLFKSVDVFGIDSDVRILVNRIPPKVWGSIFRCDFSFLLKAAEAEHLTARCIPHIALSHEIRTLAVRKSRHALKHHGHSVIKDSDSKPDPFAFVKDQFVDPYSALIGNGICDSASLSEHEAYELANKSTDNKTVNTLLITVQEWIKLGRTSLVHAAYIGAPKLLNHFVGCLDADLADIQRFPLSYISPVDRKIDRALCDILRHIPEVRTASGSRHAKDGDGYSDLRKAALIYPSLTLRRTRCLCAATLTILTGLSYPSDRFESQNLLALETLLSVLVALPGPPKPEVEDVCLMVLEVVFEEERLNNGVPSYLRSLLTSTLSFLRRCKLEGEVGKRIGRLNAIMNTECLSEAAAENAQLLTLSLPRKQ